MSETSPGLIDIVQKKPSENKDGLFSRSETHYQAPLNEGENHTVTLVAEETISRFKKIRTDLEKDLASDYGYTKTELTQTLENSRKLSLKAHERFFSLPETKQVGVIALSSLDHEIEHYKQFAKQEAPTGILFTKSINEVFTHGPVDDTPEETANVTEVKNLLMTYSSYATLKEVQSRIAEFSFAKTVPQEVTHEDEIIICQLSFSEMVINFVKRSDIENNQSELDQLSSQINQKDALSLIRKQHNLAALVLLAGNLDLIDQLTGEVSPNNNDLYTQAASGLNTVMNSPDIFLDNIKSDEFKTAVETRLQKIAQSIPDLVKKATIALDSLEASRI